MNDGRCLKKKWLSPEILNAKVFTRVEIQIIDMTWNPSGYEKKIYWICNIWCFSSFILLPNDVFLNCLPGEKKGFLAAFYCYQGPKGIYSKAFTWCRWSYFSGLVNFLHNPSTGDFRSKIFLEFLSNIEARGQWSNKYHVQSPPENCEHYTSYISYRERLVISYAFIV
jgi:hypothetical protein